MKERKKKSLICQNKNKQAFNKLVVNYFDNDREALRRKLVPISYDLSLSHMGLSMEDSVQMKDTNIVIHCASTSEYENSLEWNLEVRKNNNEIGLTKEKERLRTCLNFRQTYWERFD